MLKKDYPPELILYLPYHYGEVVDRAVVVGFMGEAREQVTALVRRFPYKTLYVYPEACDLGPNDLVIANASPPTPVVLDQILIRIRKRGGKKVPVIFMGDVKKKMYLYASPVIPFSEDALLKELMAIHAEKSTPT